ncbi:Uncharacterised protein [Yersinia aldovae]|uniref:DUF6631 family protein n=1 Tax=Yersinia aldovae TaxID=29483 RepID=UPI0005E17D1A|nr:DUF6631 family protein [Yersinia aldovae]CNJ03320.1 Uncharacterised protein [Yersinia aldovae]
MKKSAPNDAVVDDLSVLLSTRDIRIAGQSLTVREFTLMDSLALHDTLTPVVAALADMMQAGWPSFEDVQRVLSQHAEALTVLLARSVDQPVDWVAALPGTEGMALMDWWWTVNRHFFMTAAVRQMTLRAARASVPSDTPASSPPSSGTGTTQTASRTTRPGN